MNYKNYSKKSYKQLNFEERIIISRLYSQGESMSSIARTLKRSKNTISLEIKRNGKSRTYRSRKYRNPKIKYSYKHKYAHQKYINRRSKNLKYDFNMFKEYFNENKDFYLSFEHIIMLFRKEYPDKRHPTLKTIYNWHHNKNIHYIKKPTFIKRYSKNISNHKHRGRISIHAREIGLYDYSTPKHYEVDTIYSGDKKGGLVTLNERSTMMLYSALISDRKARTVTKAIQEIIQKNKLSVDSITSDTGTEFTLFKHFTRLGINWYFADPYTSGQRGQNERLNRDIRMFYLKGCNFNKYINNELQNVIEKINNLPRRKFNGLSAIEKSIMI